MTQQQLRILFLLICKILSLNPSTIETSFSKLTNLWSLKKSRLKNQSTTISNKPKAKFTLLMRISLYLLTQSLRSWSRKDFSSHLSYRHKELRTQLSSRLNRLKGCLRKPHIGCMISTTRSRLWSSGGMRLNLEIKLSSQWIKWPWSW